MSELQSAYAASTPLLPKDEWGDVKESFTPVVATDTAFPRNFSLTGAPESRLFHQAERSRTLDELQRDPVYGRLWQPEPEQQAQPSRLDAAREHRLAILARKYEGASLTREDEARVAILTQRLRRLAPRVTTLSWTIAEEAITQLEASAASLEELGAKYGL